MRAGALLFLLLAGCDANDLRLFADDDPQIGRFEGLPRQGNEAQYVLDTSNGCVFRAGAISNQDIEDDASPRCEVLQDVPADIDAIMKKYGVGEMVQPKDNQIEVEE